LRVKTGYTRRRRHKKILKMAKGFYQRRHSTYKNAEESVRRALAYAYRDRRVKKREFRKLWIARINAAVREYGMSYSKFMHALNEKGINLNRKVLSELAIRQPEEFKALVESIK